MKILVCITCVPDTTSKISFNENNTKFNTSGVQFIIGPYDDYALARAIELKEKVGGTVTVLNVGLADTEQTIRKALAIGADEAIRVNADPVDSFFVASQIAPYAKEYDLVMMGRESIDYNSGVVHGMVAEQIGYPCVSPVMLMDVEGTLVKMKVEVDGGTNQVEAQLPLVVGCEEPITAWKIPTMRGIMSAKSKPLNVVEPVEAESATVINQYEEVPPKGNIKMFDATQLDALVNEIKTKLL